MKLELKYENLKNGPAVLKQKRGRPRLDYLRSAGDASAKNETMSA